MNSELKNAKGGRKNQTGLNHITFKNKTKKKHLKWRNPFQM